MRLWLVRGFFSLGFPVYVISDHKHRQAGLTHNAVLVDTAVLCGR